MFDMFDKAFAINMMRKAIPMKMHIPSQLRIRPSRARVPYRLATDACQIPRMFSNGAMRANSKPSFPRSRTINQHPRKKDSGARKPQSKE